MRHRGDGIATRLAAALLALVLLGGQAARAETGVPDRAMAVAAGPGAGINILSDDPLWSKSGPARFTLADLARIHARGFKTVRVNLQAFAHMDEAGRLDPARTLVVGPTNWDSSGFLPGSCCRRATGT